MIKRTPPRKGLKNFMYFFWIVGCHSFQVLSFELMFFSSFWWVFSLTEQQRTEKVISNFHLELSAIFRGGFLHAQKSYMPRPMRHPDRWPSEVSRGRCGTGATLRLSLGSMEDVRYPLVAAGVETTRVPRYPEVRWIISGLVRSQLFKDLSG